MRRTLGVTLIAWLAASYLGSVWFCVRTWHKLTSPAPITETNQMVYFHVIGLNGSGEPVLLLHEDSELLDEQRADPNFRSAASHDYGPVLWRSDASGGGQYRFYLPKGKVSAIQRALTARMNDPLQSITIRLLKDDPVAKRQTIEVNRRSDDFDWYSIYEVTGKGVVPVAYYDIVKGDAAQSVGSALLVFLPSQVVTVALYAAWRKRAR